MDPRFRGNDVRGGGRKSYFHGNVESDPTYMNPPARWGYDAAACCLMRFISPPARMMSMISLG